MCLGCASVCPCFFSSCFPLFFFFLHVNSNLTWFHCIGDKNYCSSLQQYCSQHCSRTKNIKNESHGTIHTFKNYFTTVFSIFSFSNNKFNSNGSYICISYVMNSFFLFDNIRDAFYQKRFIHILASLFKKKKKKRRSISGFIFGLFILDTSRKQNCKLETHRQVEVKDMSKLVA